LKSAAGLAGLAVGAAGLAGAVKDSIGEYREAQKVGAQTNAVIKSTGGAAGVSAKHVGDLATAISKKAGIDDEAIQSGENLLLTFKGVRNEVGKGNDIFDQATQTITDMSVSLKQGLKPSAIQVGKALNDPVKGITALGRVGVQFTEGQKKMIAGLVKSGDTLGAQKIILKELKSEFGGSAAAAATAGDHLKCRSGISRRRWARCWSRRSTRSRRSCRPCSIRWCRTRGSAARWSPRSSHWAVRSARSSA
jgi:phage-related minor tail protein